MNPNVFTRSLTHCYLTCFLAVSLALGNSTSAVAQSESTQHSGPVQVTPPSSSAYQTAVNYVTNFYPLWFTYHQSLKATPDQLVGPKTVSPLYQVVVAVNVDTLYASGYLDLSAEPAILTVPSATSLNFSVLLLDPYGQVQSSGLSFHPGTTYALIGPAGFQGSLPPNAVPVYLPTDHSTIIIRTDKYFGSTDETPAAGAFRASLKLQSLSNFNADPTGGSTMINPESNFAFPFKLLADTEIEIDPMLFLKQLIEAVESPRTPQLTQEQSALVADLDALSSAGNSRAELAAGVRAAHDRLVQNYLAKQDSNHWIHFTNIGAWSENQQEVLDRASITQYIQYANNLKASAYFQTFLDSGGQSLDGGMPGGYKITFTKEQLPQAERFWSITAYTPETIELLPNNLKKYNVASYTPGLTYNSDGSLTLFFAITKPNGVSDANFVPVLPGKFNLMLRVYAPEGNVTPTYVPPPVSKLE